MDHLHIGAERFPLLLVQLCNFLAVVTKRPGAVALQSRKDLSQGGLSATRLPYDADGLGSIKTEVDTAENLHITGLAIVEGLLQILDFNECHWVPP